MRLNMILKGACGTLDGFESLDYLTQVPVDTGGGNSGGGGGDGSGSYDPEIIFINAESFKTVAWNDTRKTKYGAFPLVQVWLNDENNIPYLTSTQPTLDALPPAFTLMTFTFTGPSTGFIIISK